MSRGDAERCDVGCGGAMWGGVERRGALTNGGRVTGSCSGWAFAGALLAAVVPDSRGVITGLTGDEIIKGGVLRGVAMCCDATRSGATCREAQRGGVARSAVVRGVAMRGGAVR